MYSELAQWWPVLSKPSDYAEEAEAYAGLLGEALTPPPRTVLELGSGGGNNASYMKRHFGMTLVDLSPQMLEVSRGLNPELEHVQGDMRSVRLGRTFDGVFIHDAIMYMTAEEDVRRTLESAAAHCRAGGVLLLAPDCTRETFVSRSEHGGHDGADLSMQYLSWTHDPDPGDTAYDVAFAFMTREGDGPVRTFSETHRFGLFGRDAWLEMLRAAGFEGRAVKAPDGRDLFLAVRTT